MAHSDEGRRQPTVAEVDRLIDENGVPLEVPEDSELRIAHEAEESVGGTSPTASWPLLLVGLGIVLVILLTFQLLMGRTGTGDTPEQTVTIDQQ